VAALELPRAVGARGVASPVLSRAVGARGGPGAAPSRERKLEPWGHLPASELPLAGRRELFS
jgi:hypothetical protein